MSFPIRSPRHLTGGIVVLARVIDKIRLAAQDRLPDGYHVGIVPGNRTFDDRLCKFLGIGFDALRENVLAGGSDQEILDWCFANGRQPDAEQIEIWNGFMTKRGWRDPASAFEKAKNEAGFSERDDIQTFFDLMDLEEGHA